VNVNVRRIQLTTDGHRVHADVVENAFGAVSDYAMLVALYGNGRESETHYSPAECIRCRAILITGNPKLKHVSTSHVERQNRRMRMQMRPFTRLTNAFSKKIDNLGYAVAFHFMHFDFAGFIRLCALRRAMEARIADQCLDNRGSCGIACAQRGSNVWRPRKGTTRYRRAGKFSPTFCVFLLTGNLHPLNM
jgi:hypothetical protein